MRNSSSTLRFFGPRICFAAEGAAGGGAQAADAGAADAGTEENLLDAAGATAAASTETDAASTADTSTNDEDDLLDGKVGAKDENGDAAGASDQEEYEFTIPEGYEADAELADAFKPVAKELGLSKDQAQGLVEKFAPQMLTKLGEKQATAWKTIQKQWAGEAKADAEIFDVTAKAVRPEIAVGRDYLGPEFAAAIKLLGGNNHPAVLKALAKVGKALGEDAPAFGNPAKGKKSDAAEILYPKS